MDSEKVADLQIWLLHTHQAIIAAENSAVGPLAGTRPKLAVVLEDADGSGKVVCTFEHMEFLRDLGDVLRAAREIADTLAAKDAEIARLKADLERAEVRVGDVYEFRDESDMPRCEVVAIEGKGARVKWIHMPGNVTGLAYFDFFADGILVKRLPVLRAEELAANGGGE